jgi:hypothetical protein
MRIGLFVPCYIDAFFPEVGIATLELLAQGVRSLSVLPVAQVTGRSTQSLETMA